MFEHWEESLAQVLATAHPATVPRAGWDRRVMVALANLPRADRRRRWVLPTAATVALVALGFVPFPLGSAKGALDRALAAADQVATLHVRVQSSLYGDPSSWEEWWSADGFHRWETSCRDGAVRSVVVEDAARAIRYSLNRLQPGGGWHQGADTDRGPGLTSPSVIGERGRIGEYFENLKQRTGWPVREFRIASGWGGAVDVTEAEGTAQDDDAFGFMSTFRPGERVRVRVESDPHTGRFRRLEEFVSRRGAWERTLWTECVELDQPIPAKAHQFAFPPGTTVSRLRWWQERTTRVLARGETADWEVKLHALDVNRVGDLYLTLSRDARPGTSFDVPLVVGEARDDLGGRYTLKSHSVIRTILGPPELTRTEGSILQEGWFPRSYWALELERQPPADASRQPTQVTITVDAAVYADGNTPQSPHVVTFGPLSLPARQKGLRLLSEAHSIVRE